MYIVYFFIEDVCCYCLLHKQGVKTPYIFESLLSRLTTKEQYETREERRKKRKKERGPKKKRKKTHLYIAVPNHNQNNPN